jgi:flavodoxin
MKTLILYYSRSGRSRKVAEKIAQGLKADIEEIFPLKGYKGLFGFIRGGFQATRGKLPAIKPLAKDLAAYELIIFGTPIWGSRMSSPLRTALTENKPKIKKYAFYCTAGDANQVKAVADVQELIGQAPVAILTLQSVEVNGENDTVKVSKFLDSLPK